MAIKQRLQQIAFCSLLFLGTGNWVSCSSIPKTYQLPYQDQFEGYKIIDGVDKQAVKVNVSQDEKVAVVLRDIATTSYSFLEPRYMNSMVNYDGKSACCNPNSPLMGNSGLVVYKFSFIGVGNTTVHIISRQKGLSPTADQFDTDHQVTIQIHIEK